MFRPELAPLGAIVDIATDTPPISDAPGASDILDTIETLNDLREILEGQTATVTPDITAPPERGKPARVEMEIDTRNHDPQESSGRTIGRVSMSEVGRPAEDDEELTPGDANLPPIKPPDEPPVPAADGGEGGGDGEDTTAEQRAAKADHALYGPIKLRTGEIVGPKELPTQEIVPAEPHIFDKLAAEQHAASEPGEASSPAETADVPVEPPDPAEIARIEQLDTVRYWVGKIIDHTDAIMRAGETGKVDENPKHMEAAQIAKHRLLDALRGELGEKYQGFADEFLERVLGRLRDL